MQANTLGRIRNLLRYYALPVLLLSIRLRMIVQKKNTTFTNNTRSDGLTKAILIIEAGIQSFPFIAIVVALKANEREERNMRSV